MTMDLRVTLLTYGVLLVLIASHGHADTTPAPTPPAPMPSADEINDNVALDYFVKYGYAGSNSPDPRIASITDSTSQLRMALLTFQAKYQAYGLSMTGQLDDATRELMATKRCGNLDMVIAEDMPSMNVDGLMEGERRRKKRFETIGDAWPRTALTFRIVQYTPDLTRAAVDEQIDMAFAVWAAVTPLTFTRSSGNADILIYFNRGNAHFQLDGSYFDGRGGELAHAFLPLGNNNPLEGDAHFDEDENWTRNTNQGTNLLQVAAHEIGHSLGLLHSEVPDALMAPFYRGYQPNFRLHSDDIAGIQSLYGGPGTGNGGDDSSEEDGMGGPDAGSTTPEARTFPPLVPNFCRDVKTDAMTAHVVGGQLYTYAFRDGFYARLDASIGIVEGYPRSISEDWAGISGSIDAALYLPAYRGLPAYTLLFQGDRFHVFAADMTYVTNYTLTALGLPGSLSDIDAAFVWRRNNAIYVMSGTVYYRLRRPYSSSLSQLLRMDSGYPRPLSVWNLPVDSIDGAYQWPRYGLTYFFKNNMYYRYDDRRIMVDQANPPYPRDIGSWWLGCSGSYVAYSDDSTGTSGVATTGASLATALLTGLTVILSFL